MADEILESAVSVEAAEGASCSMERPMNRNTIREIALSDLLENTMVMKSQGRRLSQACAAFRSGKYELSYSFAEDDGYNYETLRVIVGLDEEVPSLSEFYPYADFYENEMRELFGVKIEMMKHDYKDKFYRISAVTPFLPEDAREQAKAADEKAAAEGAAPAGGQKSAGTSAVPAAKPAAETEKEGK